MLAAYFSRPYSRLIVRLTSDELAMLANGASHADYLCNAVTQHVGQSLGTMIDWTIDHRRELRVFAQKQVSRNTSGAVNLNQVRLARPGAASSEAARVLVTTWAECLPGLGPPATTKGEAWEASFAFDSDFTLNACAAEALRIIQTWCCWSSQPEANGIAVSSIGEALALEPSGEVVQDVWLPLLLHLGDDFIGKVRYGRRSLLVEVPPCWNVANLDANWNNLRLFGAMLADLAPRLPARGLTLFWGPNAETAAGWLFPIAELRNEAHLQALFRRLHPSSFTPRD